MGQMDCSCGPSRSNSHLRVDLEGWSIGQKKEAQRWGEKLWCKVYESNPSFRFYYTST